MKKKSRLAILSFVLGCIGMWCALSRAGLLPLLAIALGLAAIWAGGAALWSLHQKGSQAQGRGLAISGACLGGAAAAFSVIFLVSLFFRLFSMEPSQRQAWDHNRPGFEFRTSNRMPDEPAADFSSNLPIAVLDTSGQSLSKENPVLARAQFYEAANGRVSLRAKPAYDGLVTIHLRGYSTLHLPKRSYTLHTVDSQTNQTKVSLLGLPADSDWVLYAPFEDKSLIRDVLAYDLARAMGHYAPRTRYVELFLRTSDRPVSMRDYAGVYVLVEKIKRSKDRVNIVKLDATDQAEPEITGGYIIKRDHSDSPESRFRTRHGGPYSYVYPKSGRITVDQKRWIKQYLTSFESALYGPDFCDPRAGYAAYLDVDSFIDAHWLIELSKNVDGFRYSSFLTKDRGGKLRTEPPWDWNRSFGNANYYGGDSPRGWYWNNLRPNEISWYRRLREDPAFEQRCAARWRTLRKQALDPKKVGQRIDQLAAQLDEAQQRNFRRWPILGQHVTCNSYVGNSYQDEVRWLKKWVDHRIAWIDGQIGTL